MLFEQVIDFELRGPGSHGRSQPILLKLVILITKQKSLRQIFERIIIYCKNQMWSRGHKARGQGQGHKKVRGQGQGRLFRGENLSRPRTRMLEAKAKDQGHRHKSVLPHQKTKVFKNFFQAISNLLADPEFLIGGCLKHKSHEMTSSKFFQRVSFCGTKIS